MIAQNQQFTAGFDMVNTDGTENTTATPTAEVCQGTGAWAAAANAPARKGATGAFHITLTAAEMNADLVGLRVTAEGCVPRTYWYYPESTWTATRAGYLDARISDVAMAVWNAAKSALVTVGSIGEWLASLANLTKDEAQDGLATADDLANIAVSITDEQIQAIALAISNGAGVGTLWTYSVTLAGQPCDRAWVEVFEDATRTKIFRQGPTDLTGIVRFKLPFASGEAIHLAVTPPGRETRLDTEVMP